MNAVLVIASFMMATIRMMLSRKVLALLLLIGATCGVEQPAQLTNATECSAAASPRQSWTPWYSSIDSLTDMGESENFTQICSTIEATECREIFTHRSLEQTDLNFTIPCVDGVLLCENEPGRAANQQCVDIEMRLLCIDTNEGLSLLPDLHWPMNELDGDSTGDVTEPWLCNQAVHTVKPAAGDMVGVVHGDELSQRKAPNTEAYRCGLQTDGSTSVSFHPFVSTCLTSRDCCFTGLTLMFYFRFKETTTSDTTTDADARTRVVFCSPWLAVTLLFEEEPKLVATYRFPNETRSVYATVQYNDWEFVTITYNNATGLNIYVNARLHTESVTTRGNWTFGDDLMAEFEMKNQSFEVFGLDPLEDGQNAYDSSSKGSLLVALTDLKIFYSFFELSEVEKFFETNIQHAPSQVIHVSTSTWSFADAVTREVVRHIRVHCVIRSHVDDTGVTLRFMGSSDGLAHAPLTDDRFYMRLYLEQSNTYQKIATLLLLGTRNDEVFPDDIICDVDSARPRTVYGLKPSIVDAFSDLDNIEFFTWSSWFNASTQAGGGDESETLDDHDSASLPCSNPVYAECRALDENLQDYTISMTKPWYESTMAFYPPLDYSCGARGILCVINHDLEAAPFVYECPNLTVRYACPVDNHGNVNSTVPTTQHTTAKTADGSGFRNDHTEETLHAVNTSSTADDDIDVTSSHSEGTPPISNTTWAGVTSPDEERDTFNTPATNSSTSDGAAQSTLSFDSDKNTASFDNLSTAALRASTSTSHASTATHGASTATSRASTATPRASTAASRASTATPGAITATLEASTAHQNTRSDESDGDAELRNTLKPSYTVSGSGGDTGDKDGDTGSNPDATVAPTSNPDEGLLTQGRNTEASTDEASVTTTGPDEDTESGSNNRVKPTELPVSTNSDNNTVDGDTGEVHPSDQTEMIGDTTPNPSEGEGDNAARAGNDPTTETTTEKKSVFGAMIQRHLHWLFPVGIVVFGAGVPIIVACYFLWRKPPPEEPEKQDPLAAKRLAAVAAARAKKATRPKSGKVHPQTSQ